MEIKTTSIAETPRLIMAELDRGDADKLFQLTGNKRVMKYFPAVLNEAQTRQMLEKILCHYADYGYCFWKLLLKENFDFIGIAGLLHQEVDGRKEMEISYRLKPEYWRQGFATEAARACKHYACDTLGSKRLISLIHPENQASIRVAQKLGAKKIKNTIFVGLPHDIYAYPKDQN